MKSAKEIEVQYNERITLLDKGETVYIYYSNEYDRAYEVKKKGKDYIAKVHEVDGDYSVVNMFVSKEGFEALRYGRTITKEEYDTFSEESHFFEDPITGKTKEHKY